MKKFTAIMLALALVLSLAACGGGNAGEAASVNAPAEAEQMPELSASPEPISPENCTEHLWDWHGCHLPKTCRLCGLTEGEAPGHIFSRWEKMEEDIFRLCTICGLEERQPAEAEIFFMLCLEGCWDYSSIAQGENLSDSYMLSSGDTGPYLRFDAEGGQLFYPELLGSDKPESVSPRFISADKAMNNFDFSLELSDGRSLSAMLKRDALSTIVIQLEDGQRLELFQDKALEQLFYKTWVDNGLNNTSPVPEGWLRLNPDRSFDGESPTLGGSFSGTWHIKPPVEVRNNMGMLLGYYMDLVFSYELGGESFAETLRIETDCTMEQAFRQDHPTQPQISLYPNATICYFREPSYYNRVEALLKADELVTEVLPGTWPRRSGNGPDIIFTADGSYYSEEEPGFKGTWSFDRADINVTDYGHRMVCELLLCPEEGEELKARLDFGDKHDIKGPVLYVSSQSGSSSHSKKTADTDTMDIVNTVFHDAPMLISGTWSGDNGKYSMTVKADGSFSAKLDKDYSGTWEANATSVTANGQYIWTSLVTCHYNLSAEGMPEGSTAAITKGVPSFCKAETLTVKLGEKSYELNLQ